MEENVFERIAKNYDTEKQIELSKVIVKEVRQGLQDSKSKSLLDYGCGTGLIGLELADQVNSVLLMDSSKEMVEIVKTKIANKGITNSKVLLSDFTQSPSELKTDIVVMSLVLLHIPETKKILQELYGILNDGGKLIIVDFDKNSKVSHPKIHNGFSHVDLKSILLEIGFKSITIKTFYKGCNIFMKQDASMFIAISTT